MSEKLQTLIQELHDLDSELVEIDGSKLKPSQCYHFETDPAHMLFNTNCPDVLKAKINAILSKHLEDYEGSAHQ